MCLVHLLRNLKLKCKRIVHTIFHACRKAFNIVDFEHEMRLLESFVTGIREELESIGFAMWSRAYSPRRRYNVMTMKCVCWNLLPLVYVRSLNPLVLLSGLVHTHHIGDIMS